MLTFIDMINKLNEYWRNQGVTVIYPYDLEKGAATFSPATFLEVLRKKEWKVAYIEPCRRPADGRYGENPNRLQKYYQYQVILKPIPENSIKLYADSLRKLGIDLKVHDLRLIEDDWESPTLGAWGLGWEIWLDGMEITQFTYFQQVGGRDLKVPALEITYGLERIAMFINGKETVYDIPWDENYRYGDLVRDSEEQFCIYNFEMASKEFLMKEFELNEAEFWKNVKRIEDVPLVLYEFVMKCSHFFNLLDSRGFLSTVERANYIKRVMKMASEFAKVFKEG